MELTIKQGGQGLGWNAEYRGIKASAHTEAGCLRMIATILEDRAKRSQGEQTNANPPLTT